MLSRRDVAHDQVLPAKPSAQFPSAPKRLRIVVTDVLRGLDINEGTTAIAVADEEIGLFGIKGVARV